MSGSALSSRPARRVATALAAATLATLSACNDGAEDNQAQASAEPTEKTLAALVADADGLSTVSGALSDAGLAQVFDGAASYTLLAPQDAAFDKLGEAGDDLRGAEQRPAMVAVLRDHIVPGYLTPDDIRAAIDRSGGDGAKMRTMGDHIVTFTKDGNAIVVTHEDGSTARIAGDALLGGNGVVLPLDSVLKKVG